MTTSSVRHAAALTIAILLTALLAPLSVPAPATADAGDAIPGVPRLDAVSLSIGYQFGCAIVSDGSIRCWGAGSHGELGQGGTANVGDQPGETAVQVDLGGRTAVAVTTGYYHACAILDTGQLRCWGDNSQGQLLQGNTSNIGDQPGETPVPVDLGPGRTAAAVSAGGLFTCAILDNGQVRCWGDNNVGQLLQGNTSDVGDQGGETTVPIDLGPGRTAVAIATGDYFACAILDTGQLRCWGGNAFGQLLQGNTGAVGDAVGELTVPISLGGRSAVAVSAGAAHVCAIDDLGQLRCWGANNQGQLARGDNNDFGDDLGEAEAPPVALPAGRRAIAVTNGYAHGCAILDDGQLQCWGGNGSRLGQGTSPDYGDDPGETTLSVDIETPVRAVSSGSGGLFTCAASPSGVRCWGANGSGQLLLGNTSNYGAQPGQVPRALPPIPLGQPLGRDTDRDGLRDTVDACPTVAGYRANGCPEAQLKGRKVLLETMLAKKKATAKCPARAQVVVKTRGKGKQGPIRVVKRLKTKPVTGGCLVKGKVKLHAKPKNTAQVKVTVTGKKLRTKRLTAVRL